MGVRSSTARFLALLVQSVVPLSSKAQSFGTTSAAQVIAKMVGDVLELAQQVELTYTHRCNQSTLSACAGANYQACLSSLPAPTCPRGLLYTDQLCGDGTTCSKLWDFTTSCLLLPAIVANGSHGNPTDPLVIEGVCATRLLEKWYQEKVAKDKPFWVGYGLDSPQQYFGGQAGYFRLLAARSSNSCGGFDPRKRPWYAAAVSGPKNVILLLDTSQSMGENGMLDLLKIAALTVIGRLSVGDRIAVIPFNDSASVLGSKMGIVYPATSDNKDLLLTLVAGLSAGGEPNLLNGFTKAFDVLNASAINGHAVKCHSTILLMSGGGMSSNSSSTEDDLLQFVSNRSRELMNVVGGKIITFTYSIATNGTGDALLKKIACATEYGVWNKVVNGTDVSGSLQSFYTMFALGLGSNASQDFVAWSEPYLYFGQSTIGTTVSAPVYDRSKDPPLFVGVAGIDFELTALDIALGSEGNSSASVSRIVAAATSVCPSLELTPCVIQSLRQSASGHGAICGNSNCTGQHLVQVLEEKCPNVTQYPSDLWANIDFDNISFVDRACCKVGENESSSSCPVANSTSLTTMTRFWAWRGLLGLWVSYAAIVLL